MMKNNAPSHCFLELKINEGDVIRVNYLQEQASHHMD